MVRKEFVADEKFLEGEAVSVCCAHGDTVLYPLAEVEMEVDGVKIGVRAAVSEKLPVPVLLGTDVPELGNLLQQDPRAAHSEGVVETVVTTCGLEEGSYGEESEESSSEEEVPVVSNEESLEGEVESLSQAGEESLVVVTRAQRRRQQAEEEEQLLKESLSGVQPSPLEGDEVVLDQSVEADGGVFGSQLSGITSWRAGRTV